MHKINSRMNQSAWIPSVLSTLSVLLVILLSITLFLINIPPSKASTSPSVLILVQSAENNNLNELKTIKIIENNDYYDLLYSDLFNDVEEDNSIYRLKTFSNDVVENDASPFPENFVYEMNLEVSRIQIININTLDVVFEKRFLLCNNNNVCEPCFDDAGLLGKQCSVMESSLTCADCKNSGKDSYCQILHDNICDPDCNNLEAECVDEKTGKLINDQSSSASSSILLNEDEYFCQEFYNGELCREGFECLVASSVVNDKVCCRGKCVDSFVLKDDLAADNRNFEEYYKNNFKDTSIFSKNLDVGTPVETNVSLNLFLGISLLVTIIIITGYIIIKKQRQKSRQLFYEVNLLISKYSYDQIRKILRKKGYGADDIEKAISIHYNKYRDYYDNQFNKLKKN